jgi:hypothetical protein
MIKPNHIGISALLIWVSSILFSACSHISHTYTGPSITWKSRPIEIDLDSLADIRTTDRLFEYMAGESVRREVKSDQSFFFTQAFLAGFPGTVQAFIYRNVNNGSLSFSYSWRTGKMWDEPSADTPKNDSIVSMRGMPLFNELANRLSPRYAPGEHVTGSEMNTALWLNLTHPQGRFMFTTGEIIQLQIDGRR